jgi:hypothetical protein
MSEDTNQNVTEAPEESFIAKLTIKDMKCRPAAPEEGQAYRALARIAGVARGIVTKPNRETGEVHIALAGDFIGTNVVTGREFRSGVLYLPSGAHEQMTSQFNGENPSPIEFAVEIRTVTSSNRIGYSYEVVPLFKAAAVDPLAKFRGLITTKPQKAIAHQAHQ